MLRNHDEVSNLFTMGEGCPLHGEEPMRECASCGAEFCCACHPRALVCPDCVEPGAEDEEKGDPDVEDLKGPDLPLDITPSLPAGDADNEEERP
ncbi:MAG: hypothetical protein NTV49_07150 [Kiritimatiellaeota bacterium]|nr:hypothetical protein [Kiritimatiellota bacterium]